jgi:hypothetical protein
MLTRTVMLCSADVHIRQNGEFEPLLGNGGLGGYNTTFSFDYRVPGYSICTPQQKTEPLLVSGAPELFFQAETAHFGHHFG